MHRVLSLGFILLVALTMVPVCSALQVGTARVNITPLFIEGIPMSGYSGRDEKGATGLHDSLYARILVLDDGETRIALASLDLIGLNVDFDPSPGRLARMLREAGMDGWLMTATHTHGGPGVLDLTGPYEADRSWPPDAPYVNWLEDRIAEAVRRASRHLQPVRLSVGRGSVGISFNRRLVKPDGTVEMIWGRGRQFTPDQLGPTDPEVGVVRIDDLSGEPVAVLFNYACHAVVLGSGNRKLTADFPGYAMAYVEAQYPGCTALFLQGAAGDLDPYIDVQNDFGPARDQGEQLGREVVRVSQDLEQGKGTAIEEDTRIDWTVLERTFYRFHDTSRQVTLRFYLMEIGKKLAFAALPGEPFVELQLDLKARSPVPCTFLLGYTNGYTGYHPTLQANREGGYGASYGRTMHIEPGSGEAMISALLEELYEKVWLQPLPDTLRSGDRIHLEARLDAAGKDARGLSADLSEIGGPERLSLRDAGDGTYVLEAEVGPDLWPGRREIGIYTEAPDGSERLYLTHELIVLPGDDLAIWRDGLAQGWRMENQGGAEFAGQEQIEGRSAAAFVLNPPSTASVLDFWTIDLIPEAPVDAAGYATFSFWIRPELPGGEKISLYIGDRKVDLSQRMDFSRSSWQQVVIPLNELGLEAPVERIRFWGWTRGEFHLADAVLSATSPSTEVDGTHRSLPERILLVQNFPNPFNAETCIRFALPSSGQVELAIYDLLGRRIALLKKGFLEAGTHELRWNGRDAAGEDAASGIYLCRLQANGRSTTRKLMLLR